MKNKNLIQCIINTSALLGESPLWHPQEKILYWVDIEKPALHSFNPKTKEQHQWIMPSEIGCIGLLSGGGLVAALRYGFAKIDLPSGAVTMWDAPMSGADGVIFNDGKCDRAGRFWAGTKDVREASDIGAIYRLDANRRCTRILTGFTVANGIAWNPDNTIFYVCNSPARKIYQYRFDQVTGEVSEPSIFAEVAPHQGYPDGLTVDSEGGVWSAHWDGWCITRYLPNGKVDDVIKMPVQRPTSCCFGGTALSTLYVTSASTRLTAEELEGNPQAGCVFSISTSVRGLAEPFYVS